MATPVARVAFSIFGFAEEQDRMYLIISSVVLLVLAYSLIGSPGLYSKPKFRIKLVGGLACYIYGNAF